MKYGYENHLMHYGVKGMKWGVRRAASLVGNNKTRRTGAMDGDGIFTKPTSRVPVMGGPKKIGRKTDYDMISDAVKGVEKIGKTVLSAKAAAKEKREGKKTTKVLEKQYGHLEDGYVYEKKTGEKDLMRAYGQIENSLTYNKRSNEKANAYAEKALMEIDRQLSQTGKKPVYDAKKVNDYVDKALRAIEADLSKHE